MIIRRFPLLMISISKFADLHGLEMEVHQRRDRDYYARFSLSEIKEGRMLIGTYGDGCNETEAIKAYALKISGQTLVIDAFRDSRREIFVPHLSTTEI